MKRSVAPAGSTRSTVGSGALGVVLGVDRAAGPLGPAAGPPLDLALIMAIAFAIVFGMITTLIRLAREDGRVEREVERRTGRGPERPGSPIHPKHDPEGT